MDWNQFLTTEFFGSVLQIILIDVLLGGDNAVVIALACRHLAPAQRLRGIALGTVAAILMRVVLIFFALHLLGIPYLKLIGGILLLWIGIKLLVPQEEAQGEIHSSDRIWAAVKTIVVADLVMSVDNVIAIAAAAEGVAGDHKMPLVIFGLLFSIPLIVAGSQIVLRLMVRFPFVVTVGAMLLGWVAGTMAATDDALSGVLSASSEVRYVAGVGGAVFVLIAGRYLSSRATRV